LQGSSFDAVLEVLVDFDLLESIAPDPFLGLGLGEHALVEEEHGIAFALVAHECLFQFTELILFFLLGPIY